MNLRVTKNGPGDYSIGRLKIEDWSSPDRRWKRWVVKGGDDVLIERETKREAVQWARRRLAISEAAAQVVER